MGLVGLGAPKTPPRRYIGYAGAITATLLLGQYLKWAFSYYGIDWAFYARSWRTLFSAHAVKGLGVDYQSIYAPGPGGLHLYTSLPAVHMGPLSLLYGVVPPYQWGIHIDQFSQVGLGLLLGWFVWKMLKAGGQQGLVAGGLLAALALPWLDAGVRYGHPDVTGVVAMAFLAVHAIRRERWSLLGVAVGIGFGISMTMLLFLPLLFIAPAGRERHRTLAFAAGAGALGWLPFVAADPATLLHMSAADFATRDSLWGAVFHVGGDHPHESIRLLQAVACLIVGVVVHRKRGAATALVSVGLVRIALDEATWSYMLLLLVAAGVVADILRARDKPIVPVSTFACVLVAAAPFAGDGNDIARCALRMAALALALAVELRTPASRLEALVTAPRQLAWAADVSRYLASWTGRTPDRTSVETGQFVDSGAMLNGR